MKIPCPAGSPLRRPGVAAVTASGLLAQMPALAQEAALKVHHFLPAGSCAQTLFLQPWCDKVARESAGKPPFDTRVALKQQELLNFGQLQTKKTVDVARWLTEKMYDSRSKYTGFAGGAQAQTRAVHGNALGQCDSLEGLTDGLTSGVHACHAKVTIAGIKTALRCAAGADTGDACLSDAQSGAVEKIASPVQHSLAFVGGSSPDPRWPVLEGAHLLSNHLRKTSTAELSQVPFVADGTAFRLFSANSQFEVDRFDCSYPIAGEGHREGLFRTDH